VKIALPVLAALALALLPVAALAVADLHLLFGVVVPYLAFLLFVVGFLWRISGWLRTPVPFNITTTAGQQKSLPSIQHAWVENPSGYGGVLVRMAAEVFLFRSLFRNTRTGLFDGRLIAFPAKGLWATGLLFHYSMLIIVVRHLRLFLEVVPAPVNALARLDGLMQVGPPVLYFTDLFFVGAATVLFLRRVQGPLRLLSLPADYFALALLLLIGASGVAMRYAVHVDIPAIKAHLLSLVALHPTSTRLDVAFYAHLLLVSTLAAYFPVSKLVHAGGVFLSPTRNLPNDARVHRHLNPWDYPAPPHSYADYENDFREKMIEAELPVDSTEATASSHGGPA
jgi:nitrate reductase gamma subunit